MAARPSQPPTTDPWLSSDVAVHGRHPPLSAARRFWPELLGISLFVSLAGVGLALSGKGGIVVTVSARDGTPVKSISAFVDGTQVACDRSPCTITEQRSGVHLVKVLAKGFVTPSQLPIDVRPRANVPVNFSVDSVPCGLRVSGAPPGVKLYLDGKKIGELPQELHDLTRGSHTVRVAGDEAYEPVERRVELDPDKTVELEVRLRVLNGLLTVLPGRIPATRVTLVSGAEQRVLQLPSGVLEIPTERSWTLHATKPGYEEYVQPIRFDDGQRRKTYTVDLGPSIRERRTSWDLERPRTLDGAQIQVTVARYAPSVKRACWQSAFDTRGADAPTTARVTVALTISPNGSVPNAVVVGGDPKGYQGLARCISNRTRAWQFPPSDENTFVNVQFVFAAQ